MNDATMLVTCPYVTDDDHLKDIVARLRIQFVQEGAVPFTHTAEHLAIASELLARRLGTWNQPGLGWDTSDIKSLESDSREQT